MEVEETILERIEQKQIKTVWICEKNGERNTCENRYGVGNCRQEKERQTLGDMDGWY
jgi:uncharacterized protein YgiB involved in biofilm formation